MHERWSDRYRPNAWESYLLCRPRGRVSVRRGTSVVAHTVPVLSASAAYARANLPTDPDSLRAQLQEHGDRLRELDLSRREEHEAIARLIPEALQAGLSKREITRLTSVSRTWIDEILRRQT